MKARTFNSLMPYLNEKWAAETLGIKLNNGKGVDLIGDNYIMEVKFSLPAEGGWTVLEYQMAYPAGYPDRAAYWGLGNYALSTPVSKIKTLDEEKLEKLVISRELWIISWEWMNQFPSSRTRGKTRVSEWDNTLRYPKKKLVPGPIRIYKVKKGLVHLTEGVNCSDFNLD